MATAAIAPPVPPVRQKKDLDHISSILNASHTMYTNGEASTAADSTTKKRRNGELGYYRNEELGGPIHTERHMRIIVCGAGASGLCFAYKLQRSFQNFSLQLFEKNPDISGTWFENRYPGCACDVPSHTYTFSWEPNPDWSSVYVGSEEIKGYFKRFATKNDLWKYIEVSHEIVHAEWQETSAEWLVQVKDHVTGSLTNHNCDIFVNGSGILNNWRLPAIPGLKSFKGKILHSANYDVNVQLKNKRVGLIGNGSSGIQILPAIQPNVASVVTFVRSSTWVTPLRGFEQHDYTEEEKAGFKNTPGVLLNWRKDTEANVNKIFPMFLAGSKLQARTKKAVTKQMQSKLSNPELRERLIPTWDFGCRRMTPGLGYMEALQAKNVEAVVGDIKCVTSDGSIVTEDGRTYSGLDVLICATGFDVSFRPRFPIIGNKGRNLQDLWGDKSGSYLGLAAPDQPNYLHFLGPNCPIGSGPLVGAIEAQADYMLHWCDRWQTENIHSFTPKKEAVDDFVARTDLFMRDTIWASGCRSWYKSHTIDGRVSALWPGSSMHYMEALAHPHGDDWVVCYTGNRFDWLGNGFSQTECDTTADQAWYIRDTDDSPYLSKSKARKLLTKSGTVEPPENEDDDDSDGEEKEWKAWC
ncbi:hypothetical protein G7046_g4882 [Stylonectria norvegica]|nr:hypothetical protein G7046_g4882 [Stylonectria norvegica]